MKSKLFLILASIFFNLNAQEVNLTFKVKELAQNSKIYLYHCFLDEYYENPKEDSLQYSIDKNTFNLDKENFYYPYQLAYNMDENSFMLSEIFYLKNKDIHLNLSNIKDSITNDIPERKSYNEFFRNFKKNEKAYNEYYKNMFLQYNFNYPKEVNDSINNWYKRNWMEEINLLEKYVDHKPNSVIAFWKIVEKYQRYKEYPYEQILEKFDHSVKNSFPFKKLVSNIAHNKIFGVGKSFPEMNNLKNQLGVTTKLNYHENKFTLIDFWFHACKPCLVSFPDLKNVYQKYNSKGFELIGISIDQTKHLQNWKNIIKKLELPWINLSDENGEFSFKNQILSFPTNFLIDENGKIIAKNISTTDLEKFLEKNLN